MRVLFTLLLVLLWGSSAHSQDYDIYVSDAGNFGIPPWQILKYDENGENPEVFITENLSWPQDILFLEDSNTVLVSNFNTGRIDRYNADTGEFIDIFTSDVIAPTRMKIGADKLLYVLQWSGTGRVRRFELDGTLVGDFTTLGVDQSIGMDWDGAGNLYVSSYNGRTVQSFDPDGVYTGVFINNNLAGPTDIWFDDNGDLLINDYDVGLVKRFDSQGVFQGNFITGLSQNEGVAYLPNGNILIGNGGASAISMFTPGGAFIEDLVPSGSGGLIQPNAVVVRTYPGFQINPGLNDAWYNPATNGQGFLITVFPDQGRMFVAWFTFDVERPPDDVTAQLGEPGHRWLTAQGTYQGNTAELTINLTEGGVFDSAEPPAITDPAAYGTMTIEFTDCNGATVTYTITSLGISGVIPLERVVGDNIALCETLEAVTEP